MRKLCLILAFLALLPSCQEFKSPVQIDSRTQYELTKQFIGDEAGIEVLLHLSRKEIELSDFIVVVIEIRSKDGARIIEPYLPVEAYQPLSPVGAPQKTSFWSAEKKRHITIWQYTFEPAEPGSFSLKPFEVFFRPSYKIKTEEINYLIKGAETTAEDDIRDIEGLVFPGYNYLPAAIAGGFLAAILFALYLGRGYGKRNENKTPISKSKRDFFLEALERLDDLERQDLIGKQEFQQLHVRLSYILRHYIENYFGVRAAEQTTEEFITRISQSSSFTSEQQKTLNDFLNLADLVKFAVFEPQSGVSEEAMRKVRAFIVDTGEEINEV